VRKEIYLLYARHIWERRIPEKPGGCLFYDFFGGNTLKADVSISVTELGSAGSYRPASGAEEYIARTLAPSRAIW
jgi:lysine decarboxylase